MELFLKAVATVLITAILCLVLSKKEKDFSLLLSLVASCVVLFAGFSYLKPIISLVRRFAQLGQLNTDMLAVLLKAVGVTLLAEITDLVCKDAGNNTLGKALQILATAAVLWISIPLLNEFIDLMENIFSYT